jgi:hypothetical protein
MNYLIRFYNNEGEHKHDELVHNTTREDIEADLKTYAPYPVYFIEPSRGIYQ